MSYGFFAEYYDYFTGNVSYRLYSARVAEIAGNFGIKGGKAVDLGCGTGSLTLKLASHGFSVTGVDLSPDMIAKAEQKLTAAVPLSESCRFMCGDITHLEDFNDGSVSLAVSSMDVLNHLPDFNSVTQVFRETSRVLKKDGVFIFDMNTIYKHRCVLADNCFVFDSDRAYLGWQNDYRPEDNSVKITLDFFIPDKDGYSRHTEVFRERAYHAKGIVSALENSGLELMAMYDGLSQAAPKKTTQRVMFAAAKK